MLDELVREPKLATGTEEREFPFSPADFRAIAAILLTDAGIALSETKAPLVYGRLVRRLRALQLDSFAAYIAYTKSAAGAEERRHILTSMTTNVTRFFREPHHFEHLRDNVLSPILADLQDRARIRIWSAACSTGQEAYSIAAVVAASKPAAGHVDIRILATDIDRVVLDEARKGHYHSLDGVPPALQCWFRRDDDVWSVDPALQRMTVFKSLNLNAKWPVKGPFDAVFCRNVAIYFDRDRQARLWAGFANVIQPGGVLYIGHSEHLSGTAVASFEKVGITTYRRRSCS